jgi:pimeloyl-ACP methyl ester carboxylesterase
MTKTTNAKRSTIGKRTTKPATRTRTSQSRADAIAFERRVSGLDWKDLVAGLSGATRGAGDLSTSDLKDYFGADEFERLQQLVGFSRTQRSRSVPLGNVIFLHGITGSDLGVAADSGQPDDVWVNFFRLINGQIDRLQLASDGAKEADPTWRVVAMGVNKRYYARAVLALGGRWNVVPFAYDWRKDIDESSNELAKLIRRDFQGKPVHLVAHSMGGLVCRNFIRLYPDLWEGVKDPGLVRGGRLIMLGTPNYGSFSIPQVMTGQDKMINLLATLDVKHDLGELLDVTNSFVGSYLMLPAPAKLSPALQKLYRSETWGENSARVSQRHLDRAYQFHHDLEAAPTIDPTRMTYVAGCRQATLSGLKIADRGDFDYELTYAGDGRVTHDLGLLKDVPTYYIEEAHGDLARNESVISAVDELLERGRTTTLEMQPLRTIARGAPMMREYRTPEDQQLIEDLGQLARKAEETHQIVRGSGARADEPAQRAALRATFTDDEARFAEDAIVKAALGSRGRPSHPVAPRISPAARAQYKPIHVTLLRGDITEVEAPLVVVGHYKGVPPTRAVGAIDQKLNHWIERAGRLGMIGGNLGETFFVPNVHHAFKAGGAVLAGMGEFGKFTRDDLVLLMSNVTVGVSALGLAGFASVLIGSGDGNLDREIALKAFLEGVAAGADRFEKESDGKLEASRSLTIVEKYDAPFKSIEEQLRRLAGTETAGAGEKPSRGRKVIRPPGGMSKVDEAAANAPIKLTVKKAPRSAVKARRSDRSGPGDDVQASLEEVRLTVEEVKEGTFRFSALSESAVVPVREVEINATFARGAADRLMTSTTRDEQIKFGELLYTYLMPEDFHRMIDSGKPLKLILDRSTASFPWEMACFRSAQNPDHVSSLGIDLRVSRQFRTLLSSAPGMKPVLNRNLKVLIIADPAREPDYQLPGARREGREVARIFRNFPTKQQGIFVEVDEHIGPDQCDPVEILALLLSGTFDIVHYAGHGDYDKDNPAGSGWIFGKDCVLSAREIFRARKVPRLVFANACFSAVTTRGQALSTDEQSKGLAGIAQAFFERGVSNYIGSGWPVNDEQATKLARTFYGGLLTGKSICDALQAGRAEISDYGDTWGAYQHYGNPNDVVLRVDGQHNWRQRGS